MTRYRREPSWCEQLPELLADARTPSNKQDHVNTAFHQMAEDADKWREHVRKMEAQP